MPKKNVGDLLREQGFDRTWYGRSDHYWHPRCSQCEVLVINGVPCHERGCPNQPREQKEDGDV